MKHYLRALPWMMGLGLVACGESSDGPLQLEAPAWSEQKDDSSRDSLVATGQIDLRPLDGYDQVLDLRRTGCVVPTEDDFDFAPFQVTAPRQVTTLEYVSSREQLEQSLNLSAGIKAKVAGVGVESSLGIANAFKKSDTSTFLLLKGRAGYIVLDQRPRQLTEEALELLETDIDAFHGRCGTDFVQGLGYEASVNLLIRIDTETVEHSEEVDTSLAATGIAVGSGPVTVDPSIETSLKSLSALEGIATDVVVQTDGFFAGDASLAKLTNKELTEDSFNVINELLSKMATSAEKDMCMDGGVGSCDGTSAPGYLLNPSRGAVATGVFAGDYKSLPNSPSVDNAEGFNPYLDLTNRADRMTSFLEAFVALRDQVVWIHTHDLAPYVASARPWDYYLYRDDDVLLSNLTFDLFDGNANVWADRFDPDGGQAYGDVQDALDTCLSRADDLDFSICMLDPEQTDVHQVWAGKVAEYLEGGRVAPVRYRTVPRDTFDEATRPEPHDWVQLYCNELLNEGWISTDVKWRMPTRVEATRLTLALANGMDHDTDEVEGFEGHAMWFAPDDDTCDGSEIGVLTYDDASGSTESFCVTHANFAATGICVPDDGPFGAGLADPPGT